MRLPIYVIIVLLLLVLSPLGAQLDLAVRDGALGRTAAIEVAGAPGTRFALFVSAQPGPIPLAIVDPADTRHLSLGLDLLCFAQFGFMPTGKYASALPIPNTPFLTGLALRFQALSYPGVNLVFKDLSYLRSVHIQAPISFSQVQALLPQKRIYAQANLLPTGKVFISGGGTGAMLALISGRQTSFFDPVTRTYASGPNMTVERGLHTATQLDNGKVLLGCGVNVTNDPLDTLELFDPVTNKCTLLSSKSKDKRSGHTATRLADGRVLLAGGLSDMNGGILALGSIVKSTSLYDPKTGLVTPGPDMSTPRLAHFAVTLPDGRVLLGGGASWQLIFVLKVPYFTNTCDIFDPKTNQMTKGPVMHTIRGFGAVSWLQNGKLLVAGGASGDLSKMGAPTWSCEIYDPKTNTFLATGRLSEVRGLPILAPMFDGRILAAGGSKGDLFNPLSLTTSEIFDPTTGNWSKGPALRAGRTGAIRVLLPDGTTTLLGGTGVGINGSASDTGEIFHP